MLSNNENKSQKFFDDMKKNVNIAEKQDLMNDLTLIFKSKKYEMDLKSIKYKNLSELNLEDFKTNLKQLKNGIYDYEETNKNYKIFTSLNEKKEAIDFLISKTNESNTNQNISSLKNKIDPTNRTVTINNIKDTEECIRIFNKLKKLKDNKKI